MKVTIVTCTYNSEEFLEDTIKSIQSQTYKDIEHIVVDAYSTDKTHDILKQYGITPHLRKPQGISDAMNYGIELATGDLICHLHSDDYFYAPDVVEVVVDELQKSGKMWACGTMIPLLPDGTGNPHGPFTVSYRNVYWRNYIAHQTVFSRKELFDEFGMFDTNYKYAMDLDIFLKFLTKYPVHCIDKKMAYFRKHPGSTTEVYTPKSRKEALSIYRKHAGLFSFNFMLALARYCIKVLRNG